FAGQRRNTSLTWRASGARSDASCRRRARFPERVDAPGLTPFPLPWTDAPMLAGPVRAGYAWPHERRHPHPVGHRAGRPLGTGAALAAGLRRAAPARGPETGPRTTRPDPAGYGAGA